MKLNELTREWSYRVPTGSPDPKDAGHVEVLRGILQERKYPKRFIEALLDRLIGEEEFAALKKDTGNVATFKTKDTRDAAIKAGTHGKADQDKVKTAKPEPKAAAEPKATAKPKAANYSMTREEADEFFRTIGQSLEDKITNGFTEEGAIAQASSLKQQMSETPGDAHQRVATNIGHDLYKPINSTLKNKGFAKTKTMIDYTKEPTVSTDENGEPVLEYPLAERSSEVLKRYTNEIKERLRELVAQKVVKTEEVEQFIDYMTDSDNQVDYPTDLPTGGIATVLKEKAGLNPKIIEAILQHTTQDDQKKGVGMGDI